MQAFDYCAWFRGVFAEYEDLRARHSDAIAPDTSWMNQAEFMEGKRSLAAEVNPAAENPLIAAHAWWQAREVRFSSARQRLRHLWQLLRCLDETYSSPTKRLQRGGGLVLGRRWWNVATRCQSKKNRGGMLDGAKRTAAYQFPHLRIVDVCDEEWVPRAQTEAAFAAVVKGSVLRVGLCCLTGKARTFFRGTRTLPHENDTVGFLAEGVRWDAEESASGSARDGQAAGGEDQRCVDELRECMRWAREQKVHVLCFPELCVCQRGRGALRDEIETDAGELCLVIPGSYHMTGGASDVAVNSAPIWLVEDGRIRDIPDYEKADPMGVERAHVRDRPEDLGLRTVAEFADGHGCRWMKEDIREGTSVRLLYTPVGVMAVIICKDLLWAERSHLQRLADLTDLILVVAMNASPNRFWPEARKLCDLGTGVFCVNTPQLVPATDSETEIAFWHLPPVTTAIPEPQRATRGTRFCCFRTAPPGRTHGGRFAAVAPGGRELCELDFRDPRFLGLLTLT